MIKKFEEFVNEAYGKEEKTYVVRLLDDGQTVGDLSKDEFVELLATDIEVAKEEYKKDQGEEIIRIWWSMPNRGSKRGVFVKNDPTDYMDILKDCYRDAVGAKSFIMSTGWSIVGSEIKFITSEELEAEDRKKHEDDVFKFYRGTSYYGD